MRPHYLDRRGVSDWPAFWFMSISLSVALIIGCTFPVPPIPPQPPTPIVPITGDSRLLIVEETADRAKLSPEQSAIFTSADLRSWLATQKISVHVWDQNVDVENCTDATLRKMLELPRQSLPWVVFANKSKTSSGPLPKSIEETKAWIEGQSK